MAWRLPFKYQVIANGLYQAAWGINLAGNMTMRQGFATPYNQSNVVTGDPLANRKQLLLVDDVSANRLPLVTSLDVRLGKEFRFGVGGYHPRINFDIDVFNVLNSATVLGRQYDQRFDNRDAVLEIMNPRIVRFGVRVNF